ncbi:uncharacterized protein EAF02_006949 [Botrytis sinoallii]|uniref:uncharacterized protein n=1 Tax=Botrytis sinoallii TaxID=1463999 RepID=UPI001902A96A|nr:uncharacterized protein EAF02_006949 [Botrytis sinoallii]KAF7881058.1 hypothetical protein EAF02_006949 [Botrytis sinoallii]
MSSLSVYPPAVSATFLQISCSYGRDQAQKLCPASHTEVSQDDHWGWRFTTEATGSRELLIRYQEVVVPAFIISIFPMEISNAYEPHRAAEIYAKRIKRKE